MLKNRVKKDETSNFFENITCNEKEYISTHNKTEFDIYEKDTSVYDKMKNEKEKKNAKRQKIMELDSDGEIVN